jgi:hypothetical protein
MVTGTVTVLVAALGALYLWRWQPVRRASILSFRPTFQRATMGQYPNGLSFAGSDIVAAPILDLVFDRNTIQEYCAREVFRSGFYVEQRSDESAFLDAEYQTRLTDNRITAVERQALQAEYLAKRQALPVQFQLVFIRPRPCAAIPPVVIAKALDEVLTTWAEESEAKRGVLNLQVEVLTPTMLDVGQGRETTRLLRADLLRTALLRIVANVRDVQALPGAALVRFGPTRATFLEVQNKLVDLSRSRLEPLVVDAGRSMIRESTSWIEETVESAEREERSAASKARAYRDALQQYSGQVSMSAEGRASITTPRATSSDVQTLAPQIDRTFIESIVEMSEPNIVFRRELTEKMVGATIAAVGAEERASYYRRLLQSLKSGGGVTLGSDEIDARLADIVAEAKALTAQFNQLYDEFSRVSLRASAAMYQIDKPMTTQVSRNFSARDLVMLVAVAFALSLVLSLGIAVVRERLLQTRR